MIHEPQGRLKVALFTTRFTRSKVDFGFQRPASRRAAFHQIAVRKSEAACEERAAARAREQERTAYDNLFYVWRKKRAEHKKTIIG